MKIRLVVYGLLGALIIYLLPVLKSTVPRWQVQHAGQLEVEEWPSKKKFILSAEEGKRLASSLSFDGRRYMCADEKYWKVRPANSSGFVLTVGDSCTGDFEGWIKTFGAMGQSDRLLAEFSAAHKEK